MHSENNHFSQPESNNTYPDAITRALKVDAIIRDVQAEEDPEMQLAFVKGFLTDASVDAEQGKFIGSRGNTYTLDDIYRQFNNLREVMNNPKGSGMENPFLLITESGGLRAGFAKLITTPETGARLLDALTMVEFERHQQAALAHKLAAGTLQATTERPSTDPVTGMIEVPREWTSVNVVNEYPLQVESEADREARLGLKREYRSPK